AVPAASLAVDDDLAGVLGIAHELDVALARAVDLQVLAVDARRHLHAVAGVRAADRGLDGLRAPAGLLAVLRADGDRVERALRCLLTVAGIRRRRVRGPECGGRRRKRQQGAQRGGGVTMV